MKGTENTFNKIVKENFSNPKKMFIKVQEAYRTTNRYSGTKKEFPSIQKNEERLLKAAREKD